MLLMEINMTPAAMGFSANQRETHSHLPGKQHESSYQYN